MNRRVIWAMIRRDLKLVLRSRAVVLPMLLVPLILIVLLPLILGLTMRDAVLSNPDIAEMVALMEQMPSGTMDAFGDLSAVNQALIYFLTYFFAPLFLILPLMTASVIAADSFAGEKERKTLEALLYTPTSDLELYVAKVLSPWLAAVVITLLSLVGYSVVVNIVAGQMVGYIFFPNLMWIVLGVWVAPAAAGLGLGVIVMVSSRVSSFQEAYQLGSVIVLSVLLLVFGQIGGLIFFSVPFVFGVGLVIWLIDLAILWFGARIFRRDTILSRL